MRWLLAIALMAPLGCGPEQEGAAPALEPTAPDAPEVEAEELLAGPEEEEDIPAALGEAELDAMGRPELEAACYAGSTAACDRLGH